jgi:hypothetical protein
MCPFLIKKSVHAKKMRHLFFRSQKTSKTFDALDWLAQLVTHIPHKGEQMVRYYGFYSNKSRGLRKKAGTDDEVPSLIESEQQDSD